MTDPSPHELINRELPGLPDMAAVSPRTTSDVQAHADAADVLIEQLRGMVAHLEKRVIEARIAMQQMIDDHENAFSKAWDEHELDPFAEKAFFTESEDHLEPARKWILADAK